MKNRWLDINGESIRNVLRQFLSPAFLFILMGSFLLWLATGLSHEYTTRIPLNLRVDGQKYRITAIVTGRGSVILAQRLSLKSKLSFTPQELGGVADEATAEPAGEEARTVKTPGAASGDFAGVVEITFSSLQGAINSKIKDLVVIQVLDAPGLVPEPVFSFYAGR